MQKISFILIVLVAFVGSCVDPLNINIDREVNILIVEGAITTKPGPQSIRLTRSAKYGSIFDGFIRPVQRAEVIIRDSDGINYKLNESPDGPGVYFTDSSFRPEVGKSYTLLIYTANGNEYTSLPERIVKATKILDLTTAFKKFPLNNGQFSSGIEVYATYEDSPDEQNFSILKNNGTYQTVTFPENYKARDPLGGPAIIPAPKECCSNCWVNELSADPTIRLNSDNNINGNTITTLAAFIEDDGIRFADKYLVRIEHHTLTREAFQFFKLLKDQISINGDIFDPPPATLRGNMINLTNPDENVIGYFRASDVSIDSMFLTKDMLIEPQPLKQIDDDCRLFRGGTTQQPDYW
jgi:Domain of unknown function (DUF4249)